MNAFPSAQKPHPVNPLDAAGCTALLKESDAMGLKDRLDVGL